MKKNKVANHYDEGKIEYHYILSMPGLKDVAEVWTYGATKYAKYNFRAGMPWMQILGSCSRHLVKFICGEDNDVCMETCKKPCKTHSGLPHMAHLAFNALIILEYMKMHRELDDRWKKDK